MTHGFRSSLQVMLVDDTANQGQGEWELISPLTYEAKDGRVFRVKPGFRTDFASVPRVFLAYLLAGNRSHRAATLHDWLIRNNVVPRREADDLFLEAMLATGIPETIANLMHLAVRSYSASLTPEGAEGKGHELLG